MTEPSRATQFYSKERAMGNEHRRKRYIIEGNFQARFMLRFVIVIIGATLLCSGALLGVIFFKHRFGGAGLSNLIIMVSKEGVTNVSSLFQIVLYPVLASNFLILCIIVPYSLVHSHKIAGPIYRFEQSLDLLLKGDMDFMINLRKKDEFKYLAEKMNAFVDFLRRNIGEVQHSHRMLQERIQKIELLTKSDSPDVKALKSEVLQLSRFFNERGRPFQY